MKKMTAALLASVLLLLLAACHNRPDTEMDRMISIIKKYHMSEKQLQRCASDLDGDVGTGTGTDSTCYSCDSQTYCSITISELKANVKNYRDNVWKNNSTFGAAFPYSSANYKAYVNGTQLPPVGGGTPVSVNWQMNNLDAQYADINIEQMKNYICSIERLGDDHPTVIRAYFTRYVANSLNPNYVDKHSIAFVPVVLTPAVPGGPPVTTANEVLDSNLHLIWDPSRNDCNNSTAASNRFKICPPMIGCYQNTLLTKIDD